MIGTRRAGIRYLGVVVASIIALNLYAPFSTASAATPTTTCVCKVTLNPVSGSQGTMVAVTGTGFTSNAAVSLQFVDSASTRTVFASATANNQGAFSATVKIPASAALGHGTIVATTGALKARAGFLVTKTCATTAKITLNPVTGKANSSVAVSGTGFCPSTLVRIRFRDSSLTWTTLASGVSVDNAGKFSASETIPANAAVGSGYVTVHDASSNQDAKALFTVKP
jgi:hypothetical protein